LVGVGGRCQRPARALRVEAFLEIKLADHLSVVDASPRTKGIE
jgi:hypothetical protein